MIKYSTGKVSTLTLLVILFLVGGFLESIVRTVYNSNYNFGLEERTEKLEELTKELKK